MKDAGSRSCGRNKAVKASSRKPGNCLATSPKSGEEFTSSNCGIALPSCPLVPSATSDDLSAGLPTPAGLLPSAGLLLPSPSATACIRCTTPFATAAPLSPLLVPGLNVGSMAPPGLLSASLTTPAPPPDALLAIAAAEAATSPSVPATPEQVVLACTLLPGAMAAEGLESSFAGEPMPSGNDNITSSPYTALDDGQLPICVAAAVSTVRQRDRS
mmetsp:Transcript_5009/g.14407  ORF Transcript_5009/g.14407 Transcript_5009/m.14407 type:complete len:215 (-) Transcript_5009:24-668(-)